MNLLLAAVPTGLLSVLACILAIALLCVGIWLIYLAIRSAQAKDFGGVFLNAAIGAVLFFGAWFVWTHWV